MVAHGVNASLRARKDQSGFWMSLSNWRHSKRLEERGRGWALPIPPCPPTVLAATVLFVYLRPQPWPDNCFSINASSKLWYHHSFYFPFRPGMVMASCCYQSLGAFNSVTLLFSKPLESAFWLLLGPWLIELIVLPKQGLMRTDSKQRK